MDNTLEHLKHIIETREAKLAVIGMGYVGLPVAALFAEAGFQVVGLDVKSDRIGKINAGISPIDGDEPGLAELLKKVIGTKKLRATSEYSVLKDSDVIIICVETPVDENHIPRYEALRSALQSLAPQMKTGALVIVESTIAPGTMQKVACPLLEQYSAKKVNQDFYLGNCPERVMPGRLLANLTNLSRVVGGGSPETSATMIALYRAVVKGDLDPADWITAELVKTVENTYRDVQIAFANEVAMICETLGGDVWKVRELVNKTPYRNMHLPGAGVGGHCIPKDPWLLVYGLNGTDVSLRLVPAARSVNDSMPHHVAGLLEHALVKTGRGNLAGARILILGYAYLENSDDTRNSPSETLASWLRQRGADVVIHDPFVDPYQSDLLTCVRGCDAAVLMVRHDAYANLPLAEMRKLMRNPLVVDGRKGLSAEAVNAAGLAYFCLGSAYPL